MSFILMHSGSYSDDIELHIQAAHFTDLISIFISDEHTQVLSLSSRFFSGYLTRRFVSDNTSRTVYLVRRWLVFLRDIGRNFINI